MSDIPRYRPVSNDKYGITDDVDGKLCEYRDYARLKAEVERLQNNCDYLDQKLDEELDKSAMLCGRVERLTKAGDAMANYLFDAPFPCRIFYHKWNAAKEGKQS